MYYTSTVLIIIAALTSTHRQSKEGDLIVCLRMVVHKGALAVAPAYILLSNFLGLT